MTSYPRPAPTLLAKTASLIRSIAAHPGYDLMMRLPAATWALALLGRELVAARQFIGLQPDYRDPSFLLALISRAAAMALLLFQAVLFLIRRRPILRPTGWLPRIVAVFGATGGLCMLLLTRPASGPILNLISSLLILIGSYLSLLATAQLGRSVSILPEGRRLVTGGPHRWVRHPLYLTEEITVIGVFLQFHSAAAALIVLAHLAAQLLRLREEEKVLARAFPEYTAYCRRTARLIPGVY